MNLVGSFVKSMRFKRGISDKSLLGPNVKLLGLLA